jgi:hypothetical protein
MELAFSALLLFALVLPGIIVRYTYTRGARSWIIPPSTQSLPDQIAYSFIGALILHMVWASLISLCSGIFQHRISLESILMLLLGTYGEDNERFPAVLNSIAGFPYQVTFYFLSLYLFSAILGYAAHETVRRQKWDRKYPLIRYDNPWFYFLTGEALEFAEYNLPKPDGVYLTAVVQQGQEDYLYRGIVDQFAFDKDGNLDRVLLIGAHRRLLSKDDQKDYDIRGHFFILKYSEMHTINLEYVYKDAANGPSASTLPLTRNTSQPPTPQAARRNVQRKFSRINRNLRPRKGPVTK